MSALLCPHGSPCRKYVVGLLSSELDLLTGELEPDGAEEVLLETLPPGSIEVVAQLTVVVHLSPAVTTPLTAGHVDHKVSVLLVVVDARVRALVGTGARREAVDHALREESSVLADPRKGNVQLLQGILLLVCPLHVLLLVGDRVPPHVEQAVCPITPSHEEGAQVEARAVLREDQVDRLGPTITHGAAGLLVEERVVGRMGDVQGVVLVDIAVDVLLKVVEDVFLKRVRGLHDIGVEVQPPEPIKDEMIASQ